MFVFFLRLYSHRYCCCCYANSRVTCFTLTESCWSTMLTYVNIFFPFMTAEGNLQNVSRSNEYKRILCDLRNRIISLCRQLHPPGMPYFQLNTFIIRSHLCLSEQQRVTLLLCRMPSIWAKCDFCFIFIHTYRTFLYKTYVHATMFSLAFGMVSRACFWISWYDSFEFQCVCFLCCTAAYFAPIGIALCTLFLFAFFYYSVICTTL